MTPTLGYPSRGEAVMALKAQGLRNVEIAARIGVHPRIVGAFVSYAGRPKVRKIDIPGDVVLSLRGAASNRGVTVDQLAIAILQAVVDGNLVDAVLDDGGGQ